METCNVKACPSCYKIYTPDYKYCSQHTERQLEIFGVNFTHPSHNERVQKCRNCNFYLTRYSTNPHCCSDYHRKPVSEIPEQYLVKGNLDEQVKSIHKLATDGLKKLESASILSLTENDFIEINQHFCKLKDVVRFIDQIFNTYDISEMNSTCKSLEAMLPKAKILHQFITMCENDDAFVEKLQKIISLEQQNCVDSAILEQQNWNVDSSIIVEND